MERLEEIAAGAQALKRGQEMWSDGAGRLPPDRRRRGAGRGGAPGIDLERDALEHMDFAPIIASRVSTLANSLSEALEAWRSQQIAGTKDLSVVIPKVVDMRIHKALKT